MAPQGCTPLGDLNGRARAGMVTPSKKPVIHDNEESWTVSASSAAMMRQKLMEELPDTRRRAQAAEEQLATKDKQINELEIELAKARAQLLSKELKHQPKGEKTVEIEELRYEIYQKKKQLELAEEQVETMMPQVIAAKFQGKQQVDCKDAEIERLRRDLDDSRAEVGELKHDLHSLQVQLQSKEAEVNRMLPDVVAARSRRSSVASQRHDLQQAQQDLESKNDEIRELRRELEVARAEIGGKHREVQIGRGAELELQELRQELEHKISENARLRRELNEEHAECSRYRIELQRLRNEPQINVISRPEVHAQEKSMEDLISEAYEIQSRNSAYEQRERALENRERRFDSCPSEGYLFRGGLKPIAIPDVPIRSAPASRVPTPRRIPTVARAPTPPISPRFVEDYVTAGPIGRPVGLWDRLGF